MILRPFSKAALSSASVAQKFDVTIVGGGIVGCATGRELLLRYPNLKVALVDKEDKLAAHQSSKSSGVMHAGIYYAPGSMKAKLCVKGIKMTQDYCDVKKLPYKKCGKLIVATNSIEVERLDALFQRGGLKAIWSPHTAIVDYGMVTESYAEDMKDKGAQILLNFEVNKIQKESSDAIEIGSKDGRVPDPRFPFLGFHFTPRMNGDIWLGPNAVLAYKREGYKWSDFDFADLKDALQFRGMQKLMVKHLAFGAKELFRSFSLTAQVRQLQKFIPELSVKDVTRGPAGVRAQALDSDGNLVDDFVFDGDKGSGVLHVRNAPSPAATSSLAIAEMVVDKADHLFEFTKFV